MVWGESAAPADALNYMPTRRLLHQLSDDYRMPLLTGAHVVADPATGRATNSALLFLPGNAAPLRYDKRQLVLFGEYIPLRNLFPAALQRAFRIEGQLDTIAGSTTQLLRFQSPRAGPVVLGPFICYESMYPAYARAETGAGANVLVTQSNDAWFQSAAAREQHLAAVVLRAVENRRDVIRATTNGITCLLDSCGRILKRAPEEQTAVLIGQVRLQEGRTFYTRYGDVFVALCVGGLLAALWGEIAGSVFRPRGRRKERESF